MLKSFKNNKSTKRVENAKKQKAIAVAKKRSLRGKEESPPSSDTEADSDSDSEYEEILISSINGKPQKKVSNDVRTEPPVQEPERTEPNHANHFQEDPVEVKKSTPPAKPAKSKRKKVVIKKYYQQRQAPPAAVTPEPAPSLSKTSASYIGISSSGHRGKPSSNPHSTMSSRILNW